MARRLTLDEERQMLAEAEERFQSVVYLDWHELLERYGVAWIDQHHAAIAETRQRLLRDEAQGYLRVAPDDDSYELNVVLFAALLRCRAACCCEHADEQTRPMIAFLDSRVVTCDECLPQYAKALEATAVFREQYGHGDIVCDFCLEQWPSLWFRRVGVRVGPVRVLAEICKTCYDKFGSVDAEA